ncbi:hypothetical protein, partial [Sinorhizobium psoraleae]|uniref:hypothetical protein n=1 Tax=Sinorhizobium psoraleae TaxID=520838 RepID=UPI001AED5811
GGGIRSVAAAPDAKKAAPMPAIHLSYHASFMFIWRLLEPAIISAITVAKKTGRLRVAAAC